MTHLNKKDLFFPKKGGLPAIADLGSLYYFSFTADKRTCSM